MSAHRRKVAVVVTSRASYARIKSAIAAIHQSRDLELQLIVGASALLEKYGSSVDGIEKDGFPVAARVYMVLEGENPVTMAKTTGIGVMELSTIFDNLKPDVVLSVADRHETIATAIAATYNNISLGHVQGGEVSGSIDEKVRHAVTKFANFHFVSNERAAERVIKMGEEPGSVFVTGCPSVDLAREVLQSSERFRFDVFRKYGGLGPEIDIDRPFLIVMQHSVTTQYHQAREQISATLRAIAELEVPSIWFWPNVDAGSDGVSKGIRMFRERNHIPFIHFFKNMAPEDFLYLLRRCACIVGNSSAAIREGSFLGAPAVNIGSRQEGRDRGPNVIDVGHEKDEIMAAVRKQLSHGPYSGSGLYGSGDAGSRIALLLSQVELKVEKRLLH
jgi:UDP-hydrolysing UDP-N-acetyl-D-glucosamine 2-epimerase